MGVSGCTFEDVKGMNLDQIRAIRSGGKRATAKIAWSSQPTLEEIQRVNAAWDKFLVEEYGAKR